MLFSEVKKTALSRCEEKGKQLELDTELLIVIQELCDDAEWSWKQQSHQFDTTEGTYEYDLPADCDEILCVHVINGDEGSRRLTELVNPTTFVYPEEVMQKAPPLNWYRKPGDDAKLVLDPVPDDVLYSILVTYNATAVEVVEDAVPLVPARLHRLLVDGLERRIWKYTLGEESSKYATADQNYTSNVAKAAAKK